MSRTSIWAIALLLIMSSASYANETKSLEQLYIDLREGDTICYEYNFDQDVEDQEGRHVASIRLSLTSVSEVGGIWEGKGFSYLLDATLSSIQKEFYLYGVCELNGYCGSGEGGMERPVFITQIGKESLQLDMADFLRVDPRFDIGSRRGELGKNDNLFQLQGINCCG